MKSSAFRIVTLFLIIGVCSGLLSRLIATLSSAWAWAGLGTILALGLSVSIMIAVRLQMPSPKLSVQRGIRAALIIVAAYPVSVLVMIAGQIAYEAMYARIFPT